MRKLLPLLFACLTIHAWAAPPESVNLDTKTKTVINPLVIFGASTTIDVTDANKIGFPGATFTFIQSVNFDDITNRVSLVNDLDTPGSLMYYGTDGSGLLGYHQLTCNFTWGLIAGTLSNQTDLQAALDAKEPALGNPSVNGYVLSSTTTGTRSWIANGTGGGGGTWGSITGTLSDQTDLQSALNAKISGSIADKQVPFGNLTSITGSNQLTWNDSGTLLTIGGPGFTGNGITFNPFTKKMTMDGMNAVWIESGSVQIADPDSGAGISIDPTSSITLNNFTSNGNINAILASDGGSFEIAGGPLYLYPQSQPSPTPSEGTIYSDSGDNHLYFYNGTIWERLDQDLSSYVTGQSSSVDSEVALFSGTGGKTIKRSSLTGIPYLTSGIQGVATASNVIGLFSSCSGTQYLGADGACHTAGTVTNTGGSLTSNYLILGAGSADIKVSTGLTTDGDSQLKLGANGGGTTGTINLKGSASGSVTISPAGTAAGAGTVSLPTVSTKVPVFDQVITFSGPTAARTKTFGDTTDTILELGGSYTPTGTWNWSSCSGCTWPTFNQNTTGSAAKWTTARNLAGNSVDGSANVAFANKFVVQGTADSGLSAAQFLGALGTGIVKNTTTTGVLSIAAASDVVGLFTSCSGTQYLGADGACHTAAGGGDFSSNTSTSVDSEFVLFSSTGGKTGKRATGTGLVTATSGVMGTVTAPSGTVVGTSDTQTLTNKRITKRVFNSATPGATPAINTDNYDVVTLTAINAAITSMSSNLSGSPNEGDSITYWIHDDGSARAIAWGASFGALKSVTLPTTTVVGQYSVVTFYYSGLIPIWIGTGAGQY